jgi:catechol 2,3-dioxygenase-like lactoylglutathione lyase family enzyme
VPTLYPRAITHIGITVPDMETAIAWYGEILGFQLLAGPLDLVGDDSHFGALARDIFGDQFRSGKLAQLTSGNGVCIELFSFSDPAGTKPENNFEYWKSGLMHFTVIEPEVEALAKRIAASGGKIRSKVWTMFPGKPYQICYCEDPFGNIVEIYSHSTEQAWSNL